MGLPMARNLARSGFAVAAWNRAPEKAKPLGADGALVFESPVMAVDRADVLLTTVSDADAVIDVDHGDEDMSATYWTSAPSTDGTGTD